MMNTPRTNRVIFGLFCLSSLSVLFFSFFSPSFRQISYAPLRDLIVPAPAPIVLNLLYSTEKQDWLNEATQDFYATNPSVDGRTIKIEALPMGSREIVENILDGKNKPALISPASALQITMLQDLSSSKFGSPLVNLSDRQNCRSVLTTPLVLVAWKERADALWGSDPGPDLWQKIHDAVKNPQGWASYNHPDWGYVKFGQTSPLSSNSGFMTILSMTYAYYDKSNGLRAEDILSNADYKQWFLDTENTISKFGDSSGTYMKEMIAYGPSMYDFIAIYEATAVSQADNALGRDGALHIYYPSATIMSDHPFCTLQADWVNADEQKASNIFINYLLSRPMQELALTKYGFRPADATIPLDMAGSPFGKYADNGLKIGLPPQIQIPAGNVLNTLLDFWTRNVNH